MDIQEFNNTQWSRNVILVDGDYVDSVAFDLTVNFERMLGRRINKADTARWIDCIALDGRWGVRLNGRNIFNNPYDTRSVQGNQDYRMKINYNWASLTLGVIYKFGGYRKITLKLFRLPVNCVNRNGPVTNNIYGSVIFINI